jgi:hypothetical protein
MRTDELIATLSRDVRAVPRRALGRRIALGMIAGGAVTVLLIAATIGVRPDLGAAMRGFPFWMKAIYTASLGGGAVAVTVRLARPESGRPRWLWALAVPVLLLAGIGIAELAHTPSADWLRMWLGESWQSCPWLVLLLSLPIFAGLLWSFRRLAPTRLRLAGAAAGLAAGAWSAMLYCLHCPEVSALFVLTWYSLGIVLAAGVGALLGPYLLRW